MKKPCARALTGTVLALVFGSLAIPASASLDMAVGARKVVKSEPIASCNQRAKAALNSLLENALEIGDGSGEWKAYSAPDHTGSPPAAAAVHCYPLDAGYVVTFTCAVQSPPYQDTAAGLCEKLAAAFDAKATAQR